MSTVVECPQCGARVSWNQDFPFRPFCSERCKKMDLGAWAEEKYTIPAVNPPEDTELPD